MRRWQKFKALQSKCRQYCGSVIYVPLPPVEGGSSPISDLNGLNDNRYVLRETEEVPLEHEHVSLQRHLLQDHQKGFLATSTEYKIIEIC